MLSGAVCGPTAEVLHSAVVQPDLQPGLDQPAGEPPQDQDALPPLGDAQNQ